MTQKANRRFALPLFFFFLLVVFVGIIGGVFAINSAVVREFGHPSTGLSLTQRLLFSGELFFHQKTLTSPANSLGTKQAFTISQGESVSMICIRLEQAGLIDDAELLRTYLVYTGMDRRLQSGQFKLSPGMTPLEIASNLLDATPTEAVITILPGWRIEEVAANVAGSGLAISQEAFISAAYSPSLQNLAYLPLEDLPTLEGFLFPGQYVLSRESGLDFLLETILTDFSLNLDETLIDSFIRHGLSTYEAIILASIVEKEAVLDEEKPLIASVFYNRIDQGMRLETDPTVQYALGYQPGTGTWWKSPLSNQDLTVQSPYNTYQVGGLPPTPICNPDLGSLRAVAFPAETPYLYFRAACDDSGRHNFAITFEEHLNNACE